MISDTLKYRRIGAFLFWGGYQALSSCTVQTPILGFDIRTTWAELLPDGRLTMCYGYTWDGPTYAIKTDDFVAGSGFHDILCEFINAGLLPRSEQCKVDEVMLSLNIKSKMHPVRRFYTFLAVRLYQMSKKQIRKPKVYTITLTE